MKSITLYPNIQNLFYEYVDTIAILILIYSLSPNP